MKKRIWSAFCCFITLSAALALSACEKECAHDHSLEIASETALKAPASCTDLAVYFKTCSKCGDLSTDILFEYGDLLPHSYTEEAIKDEAIRNAASCTSPAEYYKSCSVCGAVSTSDTFIYGEKLVHDFSDEHIVTEALKTAATCTARAIYYKSCSACGEIGNDAVFEYGEKAAHTYTAEAVKDEAKKNDATCTARAIYYKSCSVCGEIGNDAVFEYGEKAAHTYTAEAAKAEAKKSDATCTARAIYYKSCSACGAVGNDASFEYGEPIAHTFTEELVNEETKKSDATYTSPAIYYKSCSACNAVSETETFMYGEAKNPAVDDGELDYVFTSAEYYHNYIEVFDENGKLYRIGDPYILRYDGMYYLYSSITSGHIGGDIYVWRSENLVDWECRGICLTSDGESGNTFTAYAPEVIYYAGYFWLCEAPNGKGHYIFRSESPEGPFTLVSSNLGKGIDGSFYVADNGELYFMYAKSAAGGSIRYDKVSFGLNYERVALPTGNGTELTASTNGWTEAPGFFRRGDYFYLTYSGNHLRDKSYRVAYSYTTAPTLISGLTQPKYNITLMTTDTPYPSAKGYGSGSAYNALGIFSGVGHSSNTVGPDLDSIYTAFHNESSGAFNRRLNIVRYFTNGKYILTDGFCLTDSRKPAMPDYIARSQSALDTSDGLMLSKEAAKAVYTAEINFTCINNQAELVLSYIDASTYVSVKIANGKMHVHLHSDGMSVLLGTADISKGVSFEKLISLYVVNGAGRCDIHINGMRKLSLSTPLTGGRIGTKNANISSLFFTNDAFGTSDFETLKNLPCSFAAYSYLKEENRGFSIKNAAVNENGVRQGEKESTVTDNRAGYTATVLEAGDWVKYAVNSGKLDNYALNMSVLAGSAGCEFELIVDNKEIFPMSVGSIISKKGGLHNIQAGVFKLSKGEHTLKIRIKSGTLSVSNITIESGAALLQPIDHSLTTRASSIITLKSGSYTVSTDTGTAGAENKQSLLSFAKSSRSDIDLSVTVTVTDPTKSGGIVFRAGDYNLNTHGGSKYCFNGYYLEFANSKIRLLKYSWHDSEELGSSALLSNSRRLYNVNKPCAVRITATDGLITVYVGGEKVIEVYDSEAFLSGYCGFYSPAGDIYFKDLTFCQTEE